jgi:hypothetical protein
MEHEHDHDHLHNNDHPHAEIRHDVPLGYSRSIAGQAGER